MSYIHKITKSVQSSSGVSSLSGSYQQVGSGETSIETFLAAASTSALLSVSFGPPGTAPGNLLSIEILASNDCVIRTNGVGIDEVQSIAITGTPTGGTFALGFQGQVTGPIAYNASAATVQAALRAISAIGPTGVTCSGGPLPGTPVSVTFGRPLAGTNVGAIMGDGGVGLTGGTSPALATATDTPGLPTDILLLSAGIPVTWDYSGPHAPLFAGPVSGWYVSCVQACKFQARILTA